MMRGQANLPALSVALLVLTTTLTAGLVIADGAFASADRDATERQAAVAVSDRLVSADGPIATRNNVLDHDRVGSFGASDLRDRYPGLDGYDVEIRLDDDLVVATDDAVSGPSLERIVLVERAQSVTQTPPLTGADAHSVTLPRRTEMVGLRIDPPDGTTVTTVRVNGRVVLHDDSGLDGEYKIETARYETATVALDATGPLPEGSVEVTYYPTRTSKALLEVTVDA